MIVVRLKRSVNRRRRCFCSSSGRHLASVCQVLMYLERLVLKCKDHQKTILVDNRKIIRL